MTEEDLTREFDNAMIEIYRRSRSEAGYNASRFLQMITENGGLGAARTLLSSSQVSEGFTQLWMLKRMDLTVEYVVLQERWRPLFSPEELTIARRRLNEYGVGDSELPGSKDS
jgi:hypothetical protein